MGHEQALHRLRAACVAERTALCNQLRGLLAEYGMVAPKGVSTLRKRLPELLEDGENGLTWAFRRRLDRGSQPLREVDGHIEFYTHLLERQAREDEVERQAGKKSDRLSRWVNRLVAERGVHKATVALANKMARIGWGWCATKRFIRWPEGLSPAQVNDKCHRQRG